jgi:hypothetical protein
MAAPGALVYNHLVCALKATYVPAARRLSTRPVGADGPRVVESDQRQKWCPRRLRQQALGRVRGGPSYGGGPCGCVARDSGQGARAHLKSAGW